MLLATTRTDKRLVTVVPLRRSGKPRLLFIEDNLTQLDLYTAVLDREFEVVAATRAETGYALACETQPDVIVVDVMLPDEDGLALAVRLRDEPLTASIPVIAITGNDEALARAHWKQRDLAAVLMKPCPADRLVAAIRAAIQRHV